MFTLPISKTLRHSGGPSRSAPDHDLDNWLSARALTNSAGKPTTESVGQPSTRASASWNFSSTPAIAPERLSRAPTPVQAKGGSRDSPDPLEVEADRVAERVLRKSGLPPELGTAPPAISRKCTACGEKDDEPIQMKRSEVSGTAPADAMPGVQSLISSPGQLLAPALHEDMRQRFGRDFSHVRIHVGGPASASASELGAQAYTYKNNIVFGENRFAPETAAGRFLLAHELAHVVQQTGVTAPAVQAKPEDAAKQCGGTWTCAASPCDKPDPGREGRGGVATDWTLRILLDAEAASAQEVSISTVGHSYVEFEDSTGAVSTFGFYPDKAAGTPDPMFHPAVRGCVVHPDTNHRSCVDYIETFKLTNAEFVAALTFAQAYCGAPEQYNIQINNCTTFVQRVAQTAGRSLPPIRGKVGDTIKVLADNPYTLVEGLRRRDAGPTYNVDSGAKLRDIISNASNVEMRSIPVAERIRVINILLDWNVTNKDIEAIEKMCKTAEDFNDRKKLQDNIGPRERQLWNDDHKKRLHTALFTTGPGDFPVSSRERKAG